MEFTRFDMTVLLTATIFVILVSLTFPHIGVLAGGEDPDEIESDIPELDIEGNTFDFRPDFPDYPGHPDEGILVFEFGGLAGEWYDNIIWIDDNQHVSLVAYSQDNDKAKVILIDRDDEIAPGIYENDSHVFDSEGDQEVLSVNDYLVRVETTMFTTEDTQDGGNWRASVRFEVVQMPALGSGFLGSIPLLSNILHAGEHVAGVLFWGFLVIGWSALTLFQLLVNALAILVTVMIFSVDLIKFLIGGIITVMSQTDGFVSLLYFVINVVMLLMWAKLIYIGIKVLPFT